MYINFLKLARVNLVFTAMADSLAGYFLALPFTSQSRISHLIMLPLISACIYSAGMVLNDIVDVAKDREIHPERVLVKGIISIRDAIFFAGALFSGAILLSLLISRCVVSFTLIVATLVFLYNYFFKQFKVLGSINMAALRLCNMLLGMSAHFAMSSILPEIFAENIYEALFVFPLILFVYVFILTMISTMEEEESKKEVFLSKVFALSLVALSINAFTKEPISTLAISMLFAIFLLYNGFHIAKELSPKGTMSMVHLAVIGIIPLDGLMLIGGGHLQPAIFVFALLIPTIMVTRIFNKNAEAKT